ncbi:MAG: hypothetical protein K940chlam3_01662 [Chlamydiae bacterium]|nr:hypothetical protein [Chlamydiota bacterium]
MQGYTHYSERPAPTGYPSGGTPYPGYGAAAPAAAPVRTAPNTHIKPTTPEEQRAFLRGYDFFVLIDSSGSMKFDVERGCGESRWETVKEYLQFIVKEAVEFDPDGVEVCFFGTRVKWIKKPVESSESVNAAFNEIKKPRGSTNLTDALDETFKRHIDRKKSNPNQKSIILVITDGAANDPTKVESKVRGMTRKLDATKIFDCRNSTGETIKTTLEMGIRFFQVGDDEEAKDFLENLDENLKGAKADIVDTGDIEELTGSDGVRQALVNAIWE